VAAVGYVDENDATCRVKCFASGGDQIVESGKAKSTFWAEVGFSLTFTGVKSCPRKSSFIPTTSIYNASDVKIYNAFT
jgi:hypothetical protein